MQIAGKELDLGKVKEYALTSTIKDLDRKYHLSDCPKDEVDFRLLHFAWEEMMRSVQADREATDICAEKVMAAIVRSGVDREKINYRNGTFRFRLANRRYRIQKKEKGFGAHPTGLQDADTIDRITAEDFVDFIYKFDALVPEILEVGTKLVQELLAMQVEEKKSEAARRLADTTVRSILEEFLKPLGISYSYRMKDGEVKVNLRQVKEAEFSVPIQELADKVKNAESLLASMHVVEEDANGTTWTDFDFFRPHRGPGIGITIK